MRNDIGWQTMTWNITVTDHHGYVLFVIVTIYSSLMTYHQILKRIRRQVPLVWAGTAYSSGVLEFSHGFGGVHVAQFLVFCVVFCRSLFVSLSFVFCLLSTMLPVLRLLSFVYYAAFPSSIYGFWYLKLFSFKRCTLP
jgi:hypothetical protein